MQGKEPGVHPGGGGEAAGLGVGGWGQAEASQWQPSISIPGPPELSAMEAELPPTGIQSHRPGR